MRTYTLSYNGPKERTFPYEPKPEHMYADFLQVMYSSGYKITNASFKYKDKAFVEIEVTGVK